MSSEDVTRFGTASLEGDGHAQEPVSGTGLPSVGVRSVGATYFGDTWSGSVEAGPRSEPPRPSQAAQGIEQQSLAQHVSVPVRVAATQRTVDREKPAYEKKSNAVPRRAPPDWSDLRARFTLPPLAEILPNTVYRRGLLVLCGGVLGLLAASVSYGRAPQMSSPKLDEEAQMQAAASATAEASPVSTHPSAPPLLGKSKEEVKSAEIAAVVHAYELDSERFKDAEAALLAALNGNCAQALAAYRKLHYLEATRQGLDVVESVGQTTEQRWSPFFRELSHRCGPEGGGS